MLHSYSRVGEAEGRNFAEADRSFAEEAGRRVDRRVAHSAGTFSVAGSTEPSRSSAHALKMGFIMILAYQHLGRKGLARLRY